MKYEYVSVDLYLASRILSCIRAEAAGTRHVPLQPKRASILTHDSRTTRRASNTGDADDDGDAGLRGSLLRFFLQTCRGTFNNRRLRCMEIKPLSRVSFVSLVILRSISELL